MPRHVTRSHLLVATQPRANDWPVSATSRVPVPSLSVTYDGASVRFDPDATGRVPTIACMDVYKVIINVPIQEISFVNGKIIDHVGPRASRLLNLMPVNRLDLVLQIVRDFTISETAYYVHQEKAGHWWHYWRMPKEEWTVW